MNLNISNTDSMNGNNLYGSSTNSNLTGSSLSNFGMSGQTSLSGNYGMDGNNNSHNSNNGFTNYYQNSEAQKLEDLIDKLFDVV